MKHRRSGFTLVELMVTVGVLGLLTALSVAALGPLRDRYNRRQAAELVASAAARAQQSARETGRCHRLEVWAEDASGTPFRVTNVGDPGDRLRLARRTTVDCEESVAKAEAAGELELVEWVRMPGRIRVRVEAGQSVPEWRPNSRPTGGTTELRVMPGTGQELAIRVMAQGPVCVSEIPLEDCP